MLREVEVVVLVLAEGVVYGAYQYNLHDDVVGRDSSVGIATCKG